MMSSTVSAHCNNMNLYETLQIIFAFFQLILAFFLVVAAIIGACIYGWQLSEMRKSTNAATKAAKAAEDSVLLAKQNAHLDQRAWVVVSDVSGVPEVGKPFIVTMNITNVGKTFAKNLKGSPIVEHSPTGEVPDFAARVTSAVVFSTALLAPNLLSSAILKGSDGDISQQTFDSIRSRQIRIFVYGRMTSRRYFRVQTLDHIL